MSKLCPDCNGYKYAVSGITRTLCSTCNGIGYVFDEPVVAVVSDMEEKDIHKINSDVKTAKKRGRPKRSI